MYVRSSGTDLMMMLLQPYPLPWDGSLRDGSHESRVPRPQDSSSSGGLAVFVFFTQDACCDRGAPTIHCLFFKKRSLTFGAYGRPSTKKPIYRKKKSALPDSNSHGL